VKVKTIIDLVAQEQEIQKASQDEFQLLATLKTMKEEILELGTKKPKFVGLDALDAKKKDLVKKLEESLAEVTEYEGVAYNAFIKGSKFITANDIRKIQKLTSNSKPIKMELITAAKQDGSNIRDMCVLWDEAKPRMIVVKDVKGRIYGVLKIPKDFFKPANDGSDDDRYDTIAFDLSKNLKQTNEASTYEKATSSFDRDQVCEICKHFIFTGTDAKKLDSSFLRDISQFGVAVTLGGKNLCYGVTFIEIPENELDKNMEKIKEVVLVIEYIELYNISV
jgi:hypothetical protein